MALIALLLASVAGSTLVAPAPAAANGTNSVTLVACTDAARGTAICYEPSTRLGGVTVEGGDYELVYEYRNDPSELPAIRINKLVKDVGGNVTGAVSPDAGLVASLDIVYPRATNTIYVGDALATSSFALVQADGFDFVKSFVDIDGEAVAGTEVGAVGIRYDFDFTFVAVSFRDGCGFADVSEIPYTAKPECESPNGGSDGDTVDVVANVISFDPSNPQFASATVDGGFINFHAQEGGVFVSDGSTPGQPAGVGWQIVGPKFNEAGTANTGTAQVFFSAAHREQIFGADFVVSGTSGVAVERRDRDGTEVQSVSVLNDVVVTERRGGLLITIDPYTFSAPFFVVSASGESDSGAQAGASLPSAPVAVSCEGTRAVGSEVVCTITGGEPDIEILWRAAYNPVFAGEGVKLDASGSGTFAFSVPAAALGQELTVELVDWLAPVSLGVVGGPVPTSVPSGEGPAPVWSFVMLALAAGLVVALRSAAASPSLSRR